MTARRWALALLVIVSTGCKTSSVSEEPAAAVSAEAIGLAECSACGMVAREQPAPRVQLVHRDGKRAFFCSVGDALVYLRSPSPHGSVARVFVESMDPAVDPSLTSTDPRPWIDAKTASYVTGVSRRRIMGRPVLAYASRPDAARVAVRHHGEVRNWDELQKLAGATPR